MLLRRFTKYSRIHRQLIHIFFVDETTDRRGKYVANFIVGKLNADSPSKSYLLTPKVLEKINNSTKAQFVNNYFKLLWPEGNNDKVLLMLSDAARLLLI